MENHIDMKQLNAFQDMLTEFKTDYVDKVLEKRDQMWHHRKGVFKTPDEEDVYERVRIQGQFLEGLHLGMVELLKSVAISSNAMEQYLKVIDEMQIMPDGKFRESLFSEQRTSLEQITEKIKKIYAYNTEVYDEMTK